MISDFPGNCYMISALKKKVPHPPAKQTTRWSAGVAFAMFCACAATGHGALAEAPRGFTLTFAARPPIHEQGHETSWAGHVYIIVKTPTRSGVKEDIFGFYPATDSLPGLLKGPGMLKAEYRCGANDDCSESKKLETLKRLSETGISVEVPISEQQRQGLFAAIASWNGKGQPKDYELFSRNCQDFVSDVAVAIGYPVPPRKALTMPMDFIKNFSDLVALENQRRDAEKRLTELERQVEVAKLTLGETNAQLQETQKALAAARLEAQRVREQIRKSEDTAARTIPPGWVPCKCPSLHTAYGKVVDGVRYHAPDAPFCP